jgi:hypothetical protein
MHLLTLPTCPTSIDKTNHRRGGTEMIPISGFLRSFSAQLRPFREYGRSFVLAAPHFSSFSPTAKIPQRGGRASTSPL